MRMQIIQVPYDSGHKNSRMGRGPEHIVRRLKTEMNLPVDKLGVDGVEVQDSFALEMGTSFAVARKLAEKVRDVTGRGDFPSVLAGNCISCIGTLAGLGDPPPAIIWLDAHGDFNTPESTLSGFLDGMALATALGRCWSKLAASVPGFHAVPETQVALLGARDFDADERANLDRSAVSLIDAQRIRKNGLRAALEPPLLSIRKQTDRAYLHIDLDVLDSSEARANHFASAGGLMVPELLGIVQWVRDHFALAAVAITACDPEYDEGEKAVKAAVGIIGELAKLV